MKAVCISNIICLALRKCEVSFIVVNYLLSLVVYDDDSSVINFKVAEKIIFEM